MVATRSGTVQGWLSRNKMELTRSGQFGAVKQWRSGVVGRWRVVMGGRKKLAAFAEVELR